MCLQEAGRTLGQGQGGAGSRGRRGPCSWLSTSELSFGHVSAWGPCLIHSCSVTCPSVRVGAPERQLVHGKHKTGAEPKKCFSVCFFPQDEKCSGNSCLCLQNTSVQVSDDFLISCEMTEASSCLRRSSLRCQDCPCTVWPRTKGSGKPSERAHRAPAQPSPRATPGWSRTWGFSTDILHLCLYRDCSMCCQVACGWPLEGVGIVESLRFTPGKTLKYVTDG